MLPFLFLVVKAYLGKFGVYLGGKIAVELFEIIFPNKTFLYNSKIICKMYFTIMSTTIPK
jgi:hypothetical protein